MDINFENVEENVEDLDEGSDDGGEEYLTVDAAEVIIEGKLEETAAEVKRTFLQEREQNEKKIQELKDEIKKRDIKIEEAKKQMNERYQSLENNFTEKLNARDIDNRSLREEIEVLKGNFIKMIEEGVNEFCQKNVFTVCPQSVYSDQSSAKTANAVEEEVVGEVQKSLECESDSEVFETSMETSKDQEHSSPAPDKTVKSPKRRFSWGRHSHLQKFIKDSDTKKVRQTEPRPVVLIPRRNERKRLSEIEADRAKLLHDKILSHCSDGLKVTEIEGKGRGVIADKDFCVGEFLVEYEGDLIANKTAQLREEEYSHDQSYGCYMYYFMHKSKRYCIDATPETGKIGRLINHSRKHNSIGKIVEYDGKPHLVLIASSYIQKGTEIVYDYGDRRKAAIETFGWLKT